MFRDDGTLSGSVGGMEAATQARPSSPAGDETAARRLEVRRKTGVVSSSGWTITPLRRQETVAYDVDASYRRRPARALPPQVPASRLAHYPGEEPEWFGPEGMGPQWFDDESPRLEHARQVTVRVRNMRDAGG